MAANPDGDVYVAGRTNGTLQGQASAGGDDAFLRRYNADGDEIWTLQFESSESDSASDVAVDAEGNVYVAGFTDGAQPSQDGAGDGDAFVSKYGPDGSEVWTRQFSHENSYDSAESVALDGAGNVFVAGHTEPLSDGMMDASERSGFLRKVDSDGTEQWGLVFGDLFNTVPGVAADGDGNVYVAGATATGKVIGDAVVRKYDTSGEELWTQQFGTPMHDTGIDVAIDGQGRVYVVGLTQDALPEQTRSGAQAAYIVQLAQ